MFAIGGFARRYSFIINQLEYHRRRQIYPPQADSLTQNPELKTFPPLLSSLLSTSD